jgi:hypothetical protein
VPVPPPFPPAYDVSLELRQGAEDVEDQFVRRGGRVDLLGQAFEPDSPLVELGDELDQILQRAPEPIQPPDDEDIAFAKIVEGLLQPWLVAARATHGVGDDAVALGGGQSVALQIEDLLEGGDAGVADGCNVQR